MLFLLNQSVLDIGDPLETLRTDGAVDLRNPPSVAKLVTLGQDAAYAAGGIENAHAGIRRTLAALMGLTGQVNCALFLCPPKARSAREVAVRLGVAPITTLALLSSAQAGGRLNAVLINHHVWQVAPGVAAA
jgi:hypothetical protein